MLPQYSSTLNMLEYAGVQRITGAVAPDEYLKRYLKKKDFGSRNRPGLDAKSIWIIEPDLNAFPFVGRVVINVETAPSGKAGKRLEKSIAAGKLNSAILYNIKIKYYFILTF